MSLYSDIATSKRLLRVSPPTILGFSAKGGPVFVDATPIEEGHDQPIGNEYAIPPFDDCWVEWSAPNGPEVARAGFGNRARMGLRFLNLTRPGMIERLGLPGDSEQLRSEVRFGIANSGGPDICPDIVLLVGIFNDFPSLKGRAFWHGQIIVPMDKNGNRYWGSKTNGFVYLHPGGSGGYNSREDFAKAFHTQLHSTLNFGLSVFSLLNTSNVALETTEPVFRPHNKPESQRSSGLKWHRLVVVKPSLKASHGTVVPSGAGEPMTRAHLCRGHFKDFSDDKKLFGRYSGRFWWSPQIRGDRKLGVVGKDYEVRSRERNT